MTLYLVSGTDSLSDFRGNSAKLETCPACKVALDLFSAGFPGKAKPTTDLSTTSEGLPLVSRRMKELLDKICPSLIDYFETGGGYFILRPQACKYFDLTNMKAEYLSLCTTCGRHTAYHAFNLWEPKYLEVQSPIGHLDLVRSHQQFGPINQRCYSLFMGSQLLKEIKREKMKGIRSIAFIK